MSRYYSASDAIRNTFNALPLAERQAAQLFIDKAGRAPAAARATVVAAMRQPGIKKVGAAELSQQAVDYIIMTIEKMD